MTKYSSLCVIYNLANLILSDNSLAKETLQTLSELHVTELRCLFKIFCCILVQQIERLPEDLDDMACLLCVFNLQV